MRTAAASCVATPSRRASDSLLFFRPEEEKAAYFGEKFGEEVRNDYETRDGPNER